MAMSTPLWSAVARPVASKENRASARAKTACSSVDTRSAQSASLKANLGSPLTSNIYKSAGGNISLKQSTKGGHYGRTSRLSVQAMDQMSQYSKAAAKALQINLDPLYYGSFAEIGAGQEVARWFFAVGAAAGTVAKSVSAYDMTISDTFYGRAARYVTKERIESMLEYEYLQCTLPLRNARGDSTCFFSFADTVVAKAYGRKNECHGWMGLKWQTEPNKPPNRIMVHVRMLDDTATLQQEVLGVLGVNLIHAAMYHTEPMMKEQGREAKGASAFMESLMDDLSRERVEIDVVSIDGPDFTQLDNRILALRLVETSLTDAVLFNAEGEVMIPSDLLRKKSVLLQRGYFCPPTKLAEDMIVAAKGDFLCAPSEIPGEPDSCMANPDEAVTLLELTLNDLLESGDKMDWTEGYEDYQVRKTRDFLARVDTISALGHPVLVSNYFEYYAVAAYLRRVTREPIGIAMGIPSVECLFNEGFYSELDGGILENFGRLLSFDLKVFVYPTVHPATGATITAETLELGPEVASLYRFLLERGTIKGVSAWDEKILKDVGAFKGRSASIVALQMIQAGDSGWEDLVPPPVAQMIKDRRMYGYDPARMTKSSLPSSKPRYTEVSGASDARS